MLLTTGAAKGVLIMRYFLTLITALIISTSALAVDGGIGAFGGANQSLSGGGVIGGVGGGSGAALIGAAQTSAATATISTGAASATNGFNFSTSSHIDLVESVGASQSSALGVAGAQSEFLGGGGSLSGASGGNVNGGIGGFLNP